MEEVSVLRVKNSIEETLTRTFTNLKINFKDSEKIIIKPNLCSYLHPSTGATTDVRFIDALIQAIKKENEGTSFYIVESDSSGKLIDVAYKLLGYKSLEKGYDNVKLINLTKDAKIKKIIDGFYFHEFEYPKIFEEEHLFISVPKLKTFYGDYITCALKNQYGCNAKPEKWIYHNKLSEVIYDLNRLFMPDLILVDGMIAMEGFGHTSGIPKKMNLIIGGKMPASVDVIACKIMRISYKKVKHLKFALEKGGLGSNNIKIVGNNLDKIKEKFVLPKKSIVEKMLRI
jgi:uncharacterized protein (DUF362 family)